MGSSDTPPAQRTRTKAPDFSELFRAAQGRHARAGGVGTSAQWQAEKQTKVPSSRRSMIPFLGRKKPAEPAPSRKSAGNVQPLPPITPVNTVRRSFGNGHAVLMITPPPGGIPSVPRMPVPPESYSPSKPVSVDTHSPSLGSKLAAHFTPLRSPSTKARHSMIYQPPIPPPIPPSAALNVPEIRAPSVDSRRSSVRSRSTTPRPLRGVLAVNGDEEDFSDLFTRPSQPPQTAHVNLGSPKKSGELTPTSPQTPLGPPLHFPIPPPMILSRAIPAARRSSERTSMSSQGSKSPSKVPSPGGMSSGSVRTPYSDVSSQDERDYRTTSVSGSDTDTSRANESTYTTSSFKLSNVVPKVTRMKKLSASSSIMKASSGPPPSAPLPSPPLSPNPAVMVPRSGPSTPPNRVAFPRPRANTLSVTSNLVVPGNTVPRSNHSSPPRSTRANSNTADTIKELQEALSEQCRKNAQLQEYIGTITKRYEDDRTTMTRTIEKLERNIRKKMREIEGLRLLVIHSGAVSDVDGVRARSSVSTQDTSSMHHEPRQMNVVEGCPDASGSVSTVSDASSPSLSVIPERLDISRLERQKLKEERRASKALRRISAASSSFAMGTSDPFKVDNPLDPGFTKQSMDDVLEKLQPFRHS